MKCRVISERYDFGELYSNHAQTTPTFPNDHAQFINSLDVSLNMRDPVVVSRLHAIVLGKSYVV